MLSYAEALGRIHLLPLDLEVETLPLLAATDRILARSITPPWPLPRFDNSSMDGFTVRCADLANAGLDSPARLPLVGESAAGHPFAGTLPAGACARISTGAPVPDGADGIVPIERCIPGDDATVAFHEPAVPGRFVRRRGEDVAEDAQLFAAGKVLDPATIAFLAMYNLPTVDVLRRPRVAIMTSGDELRPHGAPLAESQIVAASLYYLERAFVRAGCEPRVLGIAPDRPDAFRTMLADAIEWGDMVVTTAGVSVGEHDFVGPAVKALGGEVLFWKVSVRPGKPMLVARFGRKPFFGLPGNPASTVCNTEIFVKPFLHRKLGTGPGEPLRETMTLVGACPRDRERLFFVFARTSVRDGEAIVEALPNPSSGNLLNVAQANALIVVQPGDGPIASGERVPVIRL